MASTPYKAITWATNDPVSNEKLQTMVNNTQYVADNMPKMMYSSYGIKKPNGVKVLAGVLAIAPSNQLWASGQVEFGSFFSAGCKPVVVTGNQPTGNRGWRWHTTVRGIDTYYPDNRGIIIQIGADYYGNVKNVIDQSVYVHYIAIGW